MRALLLLLLLAPAAWTVELSLTQLQPWLNNLFEFQLNAHYDYSYFRRVNHAIQQPRRAFNNQVLDATLGLCFLPQWELQLDAEFAHTPVEQWGLRSGAGQLRMQWLNELVGSPISLTTAFSVRGVTGRSVRDISSPYHSYLNLELGTSLGKEWAKGPFWVLRTFGFLGLGTATRGAPWLRCVAAFEGNVANRHRYRTCALGYFGFGPKNGVEIHHFHGWGKYRHQSIDLGAGYDYHSTIWGTVGMLYAFRVFARTYPEYTHHVILHYNLPFSLL